MDSKDSINVPTPSGTDEKAALEKLELRLAKGKQLLSEQRIPQGQLNIWIGSVKGELRKIYGQNADILKFLPPIKENLPPEDIKTIATNLINRVEQFINYLHEIAGKVFDVGKRGKIFIGHGRSPLWRELKDFIADRLGLSWNEFNSESVAGLTTFERLSLMLFEAEFAFLIMTAEDEHLDSSLHARENVVHEVGLFQGRLGPKKAIILIEDGCKEFTNIVGLSQIRFPKGDISARFEEIRRVLEREGIVQV